MIHHALGQPLREWKQILRQMSRLSTATAAWAAGDHPKGSFLACRWHGLHFYVQLLRQGRRQGEQSRGGAVAKMWRRSWSAPAATPAIAWPTMDWTKPKAALARLSLADRAAAW
jgi:hypothetical protein